MLHLISFILLFMLLNFTTFIKQYANIYTFVPPVKVDNSVYLISYYIATHRILHTLNTHTCKTYQSYFGNEQMAI